MLPELSGLFLWLSKTKSMHFWCPKTVFNNVTGCLIPSDEINILCQEARLGCRNHIHNTGFWTLWKAYESQCRNINRRLGNMAANIVWVQNRNKTGVCVDRQSLCKKLVSMATSTTVYLKHQKHMWLDTPNIVVCDTSTVWRVHMNHSTGWILSSWTKSLTI